MEEFDKLEHKPYGAPKMSRGREFNLQELVGLDKPILEKLSRPLEILDKPAKGGGKDRYVPHQAVSRLLNEVYGLHWEIEPIREIITDTDVAVLIKIWYYTGNGERKSRSQWGGSKVYSTDELGQKLMGATSKAIRKVATLLGVAGSIEDMEDHPITEDQFQKIAELLRAAGVAGDRLNKKLTRVADSSYLEADAMIRELKG